MAAVRARLPDCSLSYKSGQNNADAVLSQDKKDRKSKKQKKKTWCHTAAVHTGKTASSLPFRCFPFPASSEPLYFQGIRKSWKKKEEKREERKQKRRRNNNGQQSCLISTACKKCLIKKKTLNKEENSPSFQSLAFLSASVQQKL